MDDNLCCSLCNQKLSEYEKCANCGDKATLLCSICNEDVLLINNSDLRCSGCEFFICDDCWEKDDTCWFPGEAFCKSCWGKNEKCPKCNDYLENIMLNDDYEPCDGFPHS